MFIGTKKPEKMPVHLTISKEKQMQALTIPHKQYLTVEEAQIYLGCSRNYVTQQAKRYGFYKNSNGYYKRSDLDLILSGAKPVRIQNLAVNMNIRKGRR